MTISMYAASAPVFQRALHNLAKILDKAQTHANTHKIDAHVLLQARLFPNMFSMLRQVQIACDFAKSTCARLAGIEVPSFEDNEQTFAELQARIEKTLAFIGTVTAAQIDGSETRAITTQAGSQTRQFTGQDYLLYYSLPNFYFHMTTAYDILRHNGVELGKRDYMGG